MSGDGWYARYPSDFIIGTISMTLEEKGAYSICLDMMYANGGPIHDDPRYISGVCGCSVRKWKAIRLRLIEEGKLIECDGRLSNERVGSEITKLKLTRDKQRENGVKSARKRAETKAKSNETNDLGSTSRARSPQPQPQPDKKEKKKRASAPSKYAFLGQVIKLSELDLKRWKKSFTRIDVEAELESRDAWLANDASDDDRKRWFMSTAAHLKNANQKALERGSGQRDEEDGLAFDGHFGMPLKFD